MTMNLSFNGISLTLGNRFNSPFTTTNFPRERLDLPSFTRSFNGSMLANSISYEAPHTWSVGVNLKPTDAAKLRQIHSLWLLKRPFEYLSLDDFIQPIYEPGSSTANRTRALGAGSTATLTSQGLTYLARFNVVFFDAPEFAKNGAWVKCQLMAKVYSKLRSGNLQL